MKVTGSTITDEQIRELRTPFYGSTYTTVSIALGERKPFPSLSKLSARYACADLWNARHAKDGES